MPIFEKTFTPQAASATAIAPSQAIFANVPMTLTAQSQIVIDSGGLTRRIQIQCTNGIPAVIFTVRGLNSVGSLLTETITGVGPTPVVSVNYYTSITSITPNTTDPSLVIIGTNGQVGSPVFAINHYVRTAYAMKVNITGTITYSIFETFNDILKPVNMGGTGAVPAIYSLAQDTNLVAETASSYGRLAMGCTGWAFGTASFTNGATISFCVIEPSNSNLG